MKRIGFLLVVVLFSMNFYGQVWDNSKPDKRFTFGVRAGLNIADWSLGYDNDGRISTKSITGFHGGVNVDYNIIKSFSIETGLYYSAKGAKWEETYYSAIYGYIDEDFKAKAQTLQIPVLALFRLNLTDDLQLQLKGGGYAGYIVKIHSATDIIGESGRSLDAGVLLGAGISYHKFYMGANYELGLTRIDSYGEPKNRTISISVGYDF